MAKHEEPEGDDPLRRNGSDANDAGPADGAAESDPTSVEPGGEGALASELAAAKRQAAENYDQYLRSVAEMQNVLRRHDRDRADLGKYAVESLARDLLPTLDDLERAMEHSAAATAAGDAGLVAGVELVRKGLLAVLEKHGIVRISALGQPFDPSRHEAVGMTDGGGAAPNTVVAEHRSGYTIGDRLLRPSIVVVAMPKATASDS